MFSLATLRNNRLHSLFSKDHDIFNLFEGFDNMFGAGNLYVAGNQDDIVGTMELPGVKKDDISVELFDGYITISGERARNMQGESWYGKFTESFGVPRGTEHQDVDVKLANGILTIRVNRRHKTEVSTKLEIFED